MLFVKCWGKTTKLDTKYSLFSKTSLQKCKNKDIHEYTKLRKFVVSTPALQEMPMGGLEAEIKGDSNSKLYNVINNSNKGK